MPSPRQRCATFLSVLCLLIMSLPSASAFEIVAHRGSSDDAPENTLAAVRLAWERGADAVEVDLRLTKDNQLVVLHDADTQRTTGVPGRASDRTLVELQALDAGRWKADRYQGEAIPTLDELLATRPLPGRLFLEIKGGPEMTPALTAALRKATLEPTKTVIIGFDLAAVTAVKKALPAIKVLWLVDVKKDPWFASTPRLEPFIKQTLAAGLDGLNLSRKWPLERTTIDAVHAAGLQIWVWTVDDATQASHLRALGVDGITTNRPGWMRQQLHKEGPQPLDANITSP